MKIFLISLLTIFAVSPFVFGHRVFDKEAVGIKANQISSVLSIRDEISPTLVPLSEPELLNIPKLNIKAQVELVGQAEDGRMEVPKKDDDVGWWRLGAKPGEVGNAVLAGHYDRIDGGPAVFYDLDLLDVGDTIEITAKDDKNLTFKVYKKEVYKDDDFPLDLVFGGTSERNLNLITCEGVFDKASKNYSDRLVVFAHLDSQN